MTTVPGRYVDEQASAGAPRPSRAVSLWAALPGWARTGSDLLVRYDWLILPITAALLAVETVATARRADLMIDGQLFTTAGCQILTGHVAAAYSNPALQSGPVQNTVYCVLSKVTPLARSTVWFVLAAVVAVLVLRAGLRVVRGRADLPPSRAIVAVASAYISFWALQTMLTVHLAEVLVPIMWVTGAVLVRRHPLWAGVVLGASVGVELWGLVAIPIVFAASTWGRRLAGAAAAGLAASAVVLPFAAAGHLAMFHFKWPVMPHTLPALIWRESAGQPSFVFGVAPRILQLILALAGCAFVAYRVRNDARLLPWAPAMTAEFLRLLVDPTLYTYYWVTPELLTAVAFVCATSSWQRLAIGAVAVLQVAGELNEYRVGVVALSLLLVSAVVFGTLTTSRRRTRAVQVQAAAT